MNTPIHLIDLGSPVDTGVLTALLKSQGKSELVRGIFQTIRDTALDSCTEAATAIGQNDAILHGKLGRYDGLAELLRDLYVKTQPSSESAKSQEEDMLGEVPTS